jgi:formate dehydrogenase subunit beta
MFHLTRLAHMSHACVGCGHCSSVCPSNIPVADIFRTVAAQTQALFDYQPGRDISEPIPYLVFEEELSELKND